MLLHGMQVFCIYFYIILYYCKCTCILAIAVGNIYVPNLASPVIMICLILLRKRKKENRNKYVLSCSLQAFEYLISVKGMLWYVCRLWQTLSALSWKREMHRDLKQLPRYIFCLIANTSINYTIYIIYTHNNLLVVV